MHPAYSVILFTTSAGAGYGLLFLVALAAPRGMVPLSAGFGIASMGLALVLITTGLLSSTLHLGQFFVWLRQGHLLHGTILLQKIRLHWPSDRLAKIHRSPY